MKITVSELKKIIKEELEGTHPAGPTSIGPGGPGAGSVIMALKSGLGPIFFKIVSFDEATKTAVIEGLKSHARSAQFNQESIGIPFKGWKSWTTDEGVQIFFNEDKCNWH